MLLLLPRVLLSVLVSFYEQRQCRSAAPVVPHDHVQLSLQRTSLFKSYTQTLAVFRRHSINLQPRLLQLTCT